MKTIFLTGGTGFIGSYFLCQALAAGYQVFALRRPGSRPRISLPQDPVWIEGQLDQDFRDTLSLCDVVVHLAAHTPNPPYDTFLNCLYWNVTAPLGLFEQAYSVGVKKILIAGSCFEYGFSANDYDEIPVTAPLQPTMSYPTSKAAASVTFLGWASQMAVQLNILRVFHVFGLGEDPRRLWPSLRSAALSGEDYPMTFGAQVRDFVPVEDVAKAFVLALEFENVALGKPRIQHVGTGVPQTVRSFSEYWWRQWNATGKLLFGAVPYRENEVMRFVPSIN